MTPTQFLGYIVFMIHYVFLYLTPVYVSVFSNKITYLILVIFYWTLVLFNWYLFDNCFITLIENRLLFDEYDTNKWSNWFIDTINSYFGNIVAKIINSIIIMSPVIFTLVSLINIYKHCGTKS
jgi:Fe2+ transport system protein B